MTATLALKFAGSYRDSISLAYALGNGGRWYVPSLMRFSALDSLSPFQAGGINPYIYCGDDPIDRVDPSGHIDWSVVARAIKRFLTRSGTRETDGAISAARAIEAPDGSTASRGERALHGGDTTRRASTYFAQGQHEGSPVYESVLDPLPAPDFHVLRPATTLDKWDLFNHPDDIRRGHVFVTAGGGKTAMLPLNDFLQHYRLEDAGNVHGVERFVGTDPQPTQARLCLPKGSVRSAAANGRRPRWADPQTSDDEFDFFPTASALRDGKEASPLNGHSE